jgi:hypothetical protein
VNRVYELNADIAYVVHFVSQGITNPPNRHNPGKDTMENRIKGAAARPNTLDSNVPRWLRVPYSPVSFVFGRANKRYGLGNSDINSEVTVTLASIGLLLIWLRSLTVAPCLSCTSLDIRV